VVEFKLPDGSPGFSLIWNCYTDFLKKYASFIKSDENRCSVGVALMLTRGPTNMIQLTGAISDFCERA
jgi:hypothetical protein